MSNTTDETHLNRVAIHEAGHVVMGFITGRWLEHVTIEPGDDYHGWARHTVALVEFLEPQNEPNPFTHPEENAAFWERQDARETVLRAEIGIFLAGPAAEPVHLGDADEVGGAGDKQKAMRLAEELAEGNDDPATVCQDLRAEAEALLGEPACREAVRRLADELVQRAALTSAEAEAIVRPILGERFTSMKRSSLTV